MTLCPIALECLGHMHILIGELYIDCFHPSEGDVHVRLGPV